MRIFFEHHQYIMYFFLMFMGCLAGFIDSIAGGGGLISIPALTFTGMPISLVLGTNKLQSSIGTSLAVYQYHKNGLINFMTVYRGLVMGFIGAFCGAILVNYVSNQFMHYVVPFLLIAVFVFNIFNKSSGLNLGKKRLNEQVFFSVFGFILGFYDAFFGPGTGNFWIILIVFFLGYSFLNASGYAKILNLKSNLFSLAIFLYYGSVNFEIGLLMALGQLGGNYLGSKIVILKGAKLIRPFFITVVGINIMVLLYQLF